MCTYKLKKILLKGNRKGIFTQCKLIGFSKNFNISVNFVSCVVGLEVLALLANPAFGACTEYMTHDNINIIIITPIY